MLPMKNVYHTILYAINHATFKVSLAGICSNGSVFFFICLWVCVSYLEISFRLNSFHILHFRHLFIADKNICGRSWRWISLEIVTPFGWLLLLYKLCTGSRFRSFICLVYLLLHLGYSVTKGLNAWNSVFFFPLLSSNKNRADVPKQSENFERKRES